LNRRVALCIAVAIGLSLEVLAVPQEPIRDSPRPRYGAGPPHYAAIEVAFQNVADNVQLAGTLTVPRGTPNAPAVLLSQGLGFEPFDRDYAVPSAPALKSFIAIADALSRNGIVVLRVDDRGAIHGARDRDLDAATNLAPLVRFLGEAGNADFTVATIPDLDHWMWVCTQLSESGKPCAEMQFSPRVLDLITNWISRRP
jgi:hypothetical protein